MTQSKRSNVSLAEVARAAGVSKMTASRVLRDVPGFSELTRDRVMREVERLGYVQNRIAAAFGSEQTSTIIGVSVPYLSSGLFGTVLDSVNATLSKLGYQTMIGAHENSPMAEENWVRNILSWRPAGLIISSHTHSPGTRQLLKAHGISVVEIWNLNTSPIDMSVGFNHFDCGHEMALYIYGRGYRKIGYVGADASAPGMGNIRRKGFEKGLESVSTSFDAIEILVDRPGFYAGYYGTETILNRRPELEAIYFQDDAMAIGGIFYCQANGISVPENLGIAGWGSMEAASVLPKRLTTTVVGAQSLGKTAAEALVGRIRGEHVDDVIIAPTRLAPGNTI
jgi:LacI family gluconate utilization system Gnt-I transcriptional repressor